MSASLPFPHTDLQSTGRSQSALPPRALLLLELFFVELTFQLGDSGFKLCDAGFKFGDNPAEDLQNGIHSTLVERSLDDVAEFRLGFSISEIA